MLNTVADGRVTPNDMAGILPGTLLYRNYDHEFVKMLKGDTARRKIGVVFTLAESPDGFILTGVDEDGFRGEAAVVHPKKAAKKPETARETILSQLSKLEIRFLSSRISLSICCRFSLFRQVS